MRKLLLPALTAATATLGEDINYNVYLSAGYADSTRRRVDRAQPGGVLPAAAGRLERP